MNPRRGSPDAGAVVPAINTASSTAALRSLGTRDVKTIAASEHDSPPGFASRFCDETVTVPDPRIDLPAYEQALLALAQRDDVRTILPFREEDVYVLARNREALTSEVGTPWPDLATLRGAQDRVELFDAAESADVATPETRPVDDWDDWSREAIVKPRYTVHAAEYDDRFAESHAQWRSTQYVAPDEEPDPEELVAEYDHVPLVQEYVPDTNEYGFFALYDRGEAVATFQHRQRRGWSYSGGPSAFRESTDIPELDAAGRRLLDELDWHGVAMVEFLRHPETGEFQLMEVNPRFWSSLPFTVQAGVDFPHLVWRQANGKTIDADPQHDVNAAGHLVRGELLHLRSILTEDTPLVERPSFARRALEIAASVARHPRFDYLSASDPGPFVRDARNLLGDFRNTRRDRPTDDEGRAAEGGAVEESAVEESAVDSGAVAGGAVDGDAADSGAIAAGAADSADSSAEASASPSDNRAATDGGQSAEGEQSTESERSKLRTAVQTLLARR